MDLANILRQLVEDFTPAEILESLGARYESKAEATEERDYEDLAEALYKLAHKAYNLP